MKDLEITEIIKYILWVLFGSGFVFEISTIKIKPFSMVLGWIGKKLNEDVTKDILCLKNDLKTVKVELQEHKLETQRRSILEFANSLAAGNKRSKEDFNNIISIHDKYEKYIKDNDLENGQIDLAFEYIECKYKEWLLNDGFLK